MAIISRPSVQPRHKGSTTGEVIRERVAGPLARQRGVFGRAVRALPRFSRVPDLVSRRTLRPTTTQKRM
jgi:hypothetical protein